MKPIFQAIWDLAVPLQDKRDDEGHAKIVTDFALELLQSESADEDIVVPAAILHDIGWSELTEEERFFIFNNKITKEVEMSSPTKIDVRVKHEKIGAKLAKEILKKVSYPEDKMDKVLDIIENHDTRKNAISPEDAVMKDADKLWTFTKIGMDADVARFKFSKQTCFDMAVKRIAAPDYFFTDRAKEIALEEIEKRRKDFL